MISTTPINSTKQVYNRILQTKKSQPKKRNNNKKIQKGGKWSRKYKLSIKCNKSKGFSQKQYCKYSRKNR